MKGAKVDENRPRSQPVKLGGNYNKEKKDNGKTKEKPQTQSGPRGGS